MNFNEAIKKLAIAGRRLRTNLALVLLGSLFTVSAVGVLIGSMGDSSAVHGTAFVVMNATGVTLLMVYLYRVSKRLDKLLRRAEEKIVSSRAKASAWEWRTHNAVNGIRKQLENVAAAGTTSTKATGANQKSGSPEWKNHPEAQTLLDSGTFDPAFYAAMSGAWFNTDYDAASHFIGVGMPKLTPPHPLLDPNWLTKGVQTTWKRSDIRAILKYLQKDPTSLPALSPIFDPKRLDIPKTSIANHPGGCVGAFIEQATDDCILPIEGRQLKWGSVRSATDHFIRGYVADRRHVGPRDASHWDAETEASWKASAKLNDIAVSGSAPIVSVIMPAWNRAEIIADAIRSVKEQHFESWELIVVDDGSTDATSRVVEAFADDDHRIRLLAGAHLGVGAARNRGLRSAAGRFVAFLDSDNTWPRDFLDLMVRGLVGSGHRAAYAGIELRGDTGSRYRAFRGGLDYLLILNHIDMNVFVLERELAIEAGEFDTELRRWVDHDFAIRVARLAEPVLFPFIGCIYRNSQNDSDRITTSESEHWQWAVLGKNWVEWPSSADSQHPDMTSVVIPTYQDWRMTSSAVNAVLSNSDGHDVEIIIVDNGSAPSVGVVIAQLFADHDRVRYVRLPRNMNFAVGSNYGAAMARGEYIVFLNNDTEVQAGWLSPLKDRMAVPGTLGVQPLLLYPDNSVQTAGSVFVARESLPVHFLAGMPPEDAAGVAKERFNVVTAAALLMRAADVFALRGFDSIFVNGMEDVDLCLRARALRPESAFAVEPKSIVRHWESKTPGRGKNIEENRRIFMDRWRGHLPSPEHDKYLSRGLEIAHISGDGLSTPSPRPVIVRPRAGSPLRWGIRHAAIGGPAGDRWGDTSFANSLADSLRHVGHEVVTYRHGANRQSAGSVDDVSLVLRGIDRVSPIPGMVNVLWVISHPEDVTIAEVRSFDLVYSASISWATEMTTKSGREVRPLLQATDSTRFSPGAPGSARISRPAMFVGGTHHGRTRKIVNDVLSIGADLRVIGTGWQDLLPTGIHEADYIDNRDLATVYRSADRVLADHWPSMAEMGFMQNRLFDAVACGARVITDPVRDLERVFGSAVQSYSSPDELRFLCSREGVSRFGGADELLLQAEEVLAAHSFNARARELSAAVSEFIGSTRNGWAS